MTYPVRLLISQAYYTSRVLARTMQTPTADEISDGLNLLNDILAGKSIDYETNPYYTNYTFSTVASQEMYSIPNLIQIDTFSYFLGGDQANGVRIPLVETTREEYFHTARASIYSILISYRVERAFGGADIYLYPKPDGVYLCQIVGKFALLSTTLDTDLSTIYDEAYILYLRYLLASYICGWRGITCSPQLQQEIDKLERQFKDISPHDYSVKIKNAFSKTGGWGWGDVFVGRGWRAISG